MSVYWFIYKYLSCQQVLVCMMWRSKLYDVTVKNRKYRIWALFVSRSHIYICQKLRMVIFCVKLKTVLKENKIIHILYKFRLWLNRSALSIILSMLVVRVMYGCNKLSLAQNSQILVWNNSCLINSTKMAVRYV